MSQTVRVLHVEDSESDAGLVVRVLEKAGYDVQARRVEDAEAMRAGLESQAWDVILADHHMPRFDAPGALRVLHQSGHDIPFIVVSGSIGEELAVDLVRSGAQDYVLKDNLARLVPAVERELRQTRARNEKRQMKRDLRESRERLALAIQATQLGTFDLSPKTGSLIWSDLNRRHFGLSADAQVSYPIFLCGIHPDDRARVSNIIRDLLQPGSTGEYTAEFRTIGIEDHVERWISSWGRVFFDEDGQANRFIGVTLDITERKRLEEQFRQAQKMESIGRLAGGVAHDFNNLLTVINGYCDMLLAGLSPNDPTHDGLTEIRTAGERAAALSGQLLVLSRKQVVQLQLVNLNDIIAEVQKMLDRVIGEEVRLASDLSPSLGSVLADPGQLHQVLMNLAINARDAMPGGGTLRLETRNVDLKAGAPDLAVGLKPGPYVELRVTDSGTGMSHDVLSHIFEPFFTTKKAGDGTGLGLATVYGIVRQCGGSIQVSSEPGCGTSFRMDLPRTDSAQREPEEPSTETPAIRGNETILVVEDQDQLRKMAVRVLGRCGYLVLEASNGEEALVESNLHDGPIHLLLTDVVMPGLSGPDLAGRLKALRPYLQIVFMSGYSGAAVLNRQRLESMGSFLAKPFAPEALAAKVHAILECRPATTILVADDEPEIRKLLHKYLAGAGYYVLEAGDGREAERRIEAGTIDVLVTDLAMPGQEGLETIRSLSRRWPQLKIIAISGRFPVSILRAAEVLGAHASLAKPVQPQQLLEAIARVTARKETPCVS